MNIEFNHDEKTKITTIFMDGEEKMKLSSVEMEWDRPPQLDDEKMEKAKDGSVYYKPGPGITFTVSGLVMES